MSCRMSHIYKTYLSALYGPCNVSHRPCYPWSRLYAQDHISVQVVASVTIYVKTQWYIQTSRCLKYSYTRALLNQDSYHQPQETTYFYLTPNTSIYVSVMINFKRRSTGQTFTDTNTVCLMQTELKTGQLPETIHLTHSISGSD